MNRMMIALQKNILSIFILSMLAIMTAAGCATQVAPPLETSEVVALNNQSVSMTDSYVLGVGDLIAVKFFYNDKLNEEVTIRPDGKISLQLVGDVQAAGLTPLQLEEQLTAKYSRIIKSPELGVIVKEFTAERVYVGGEVARPGLISKVGMLRILDAVLQSGGALDTAKLNSVILIRYNGSNKPDVYTLDLNRVIKGETPDIVLRPYDIVYVPKTTIAKVDVFVSQYLHKLLPSNFVFSLPYNLNPDVKVTR